MLKIGLDTCVLFTNLELALDAPLLFSGTFLFMVPPTLSRSLRDRIRNIQELQACHQTKHTQVLSITSFNLRESRGHVCQSDESAP